MNLEIYNKTNKTMGNMGTQTLNDNKLPNNHFHQLLARY